MSQDHISIQLTLIKRKERYEPYSRLSFYVTYIILLCALTKNFKMYIQRETQRRKSIQFALGLSLGCTYIVSSLFHLKRTHSLTHSYLLAFSLSQTFMSLQPLFNTQPTNYLSAYKQHFRIQFLILLCLLQIHSRHELRVDIATANTNLNLNVYE